MHKLGFQRMARGLAAIIFLVSALHAQKAPPPPAPPAALPNGTPPGPPAVPSAAEIRTEMEAATARQRSASEAMQESLARQQASVQQQVAQTSAGSFFLLPPPKSLGATVAAAPAFADCDPLPSSEVDTLIGEAAKHQKLEENVLRGVMRQESAFRPCAVSSQGAMGLMQLMPATADQYGVKDPFNPAQNVEAGAKLLKDLLSRYGGDLTKALGAYNAGAAKVDAASGIPDIQETQDYVQKIMSNLPAKMP